MGIQVLGPLEISSGGINVAPTARRPRQVLALLLLNYSRVVPTDTLIAELWDGHAPKTAPTAVQSCVIQLRRMFDGDLVRTARNGYELVAESTPFDLRTFHRLERTGMAAMAVGDLVTAVQDFREALALWRGPALADVEPGPSIRAEVAGLEQSRATMLNHRIELELRLGRHREILGELADVVSRDRFSEDLHAQFIMALYRSGYRARALAAFHRLRKDLVGKFGLEPSPKLAELHQAVLTSDPELDEMPVLLLPRAAELPALPPVAGALLA